MNAKFENLFDAGIELGSLLRDEHSELISDAQIACVRPNGFRALGIESVWGPGICVEFTSVAWWRPLYSTQDLSLTLMPAE